MYQRRTPVDVKQQRKPRRMQPSAAAKQQTHHNPERDPSDKTKTPSDTYRLPKTIVDHGVPLTDNMDEISVSLNLEDDEDSDDVPHMDNTAAKRVQVKMLDAEAAQRHSSHSKVREKTKDKSASRSPNQKQHSLVVPSGNNPAKNADVQKSQAPEEEMTQSREIALTSPWLDTQLKHLNDTEGVVHSPKRTTATDTTEFDKNREDEIRRLLDRIDDLECENKLKDRELETNKWIEKEMERKLQNTEDIMALKAQLREVESQLETHSRLSQTLRDENARLIDDLKEKDRGLLQLQSEIHNLDRVINKKNSLQEEETIQKLSEELQALHMELGRKEHAVKEVEIQMEYYKHQVDQRAQEIEHKNKTLDELHTACVAMKEELAENNKRLTNIMEETRASNLQIGQLKGNNKNMDDIKARQKELCDENSSLRDQLLTLEAKYRVLEKRRDDAVTTNDVVNELNTVIMERNIADKERQQLIRQLRTTESMLKDHVAEEEALQREIHQLKSYCRELENENAVYRENEKRHTNEKIIQNQIKLQNSHLEQHIERMRSKLQHIHKRFKEKDDLIQRLTQELKSRADFLPPGLLAEISKSAVPEDFGVSDTFLTTPNFLDLHPTHEFPHTKSFKDFPTTSPPIKERMSMSPLPSTDITPLPDGMGSVHQSKVLPKGIVLPTTVIREPFGNTALHTCAPSGPVQGPHNFKVQMVLGDNSVMLEWSPPSMDEMNRNNGHELTGYKIFVNGKEVQRVNSPHLNKALLYPIEIRADIVFGIRSCTLSGEQSAMVETSLPDNDYSDEPIKQSSRFPDKVYSEPTPVRH